MSTDSTSEIKAALRTRLLSFVAGELGSTESGGGQDGNLYWDRAPDNLDKTMKDLGRPLRWGVMRLLNREIEGDGSERERGDLELMLFARPRDQAAPMELVADLSDQAMLRWVEISPLGYIGSVSGRKRSTLPPFAPPADGDVVQVRLVYPLVLYPSYLTQYHDQ